MLGKDGVEVVIWSLSRNERFVEYATPGASVTADSKRMESYIEVAPHEESFVIRFSAKPLILDDGEVVQVEIRWENGLRTIEFVDKVTVQNHGWLNKVRVSQYDYGSWVDAGVSINCTHVGEFPLVHSLLYRE